MSDLPDLVPLGSAVRIDKNEGVFVVIARGYRKDPKGLSVGYKLVPHPEGMSQSVREVIAVGADITEVLHRGYESEADVVFAQEQAERAKETPPPAPAVRNGSEESSGDTKQVPQEAAGVQAAGRSAVTPTIVDPKDPFAALRKEGK